jgi:putative methionine-R-sulfoxide reductase with GAF domain
MITLAPDCERLRHIALSAQTREHRALAITEAIREMGGFRWVGIYDVEETEIAALAWTGDVSPVHERFPITEGLNGEAVRTCEAVNVGDVTLDSRYLTAFHTTSSEIVIPVRAWDGEHVVGTIDVESEKLYAFGPEDIHLLQECAHAIRPLWN